MFMDVQMNKAHDEETSQDKADGSISDETTPDVTMNAEASASFLERLGWGCLTLADEGVAYSVPMSFGYDGDSTLYFQAQTDEDSDKMAYLDATTTATFLASEVQPPDWTSVIVRGAIGKVPEEEVEEAYAAFAENAWFPACPWTPDKDPTEVAFYKLEAQEVTGRTSIIEQ
jgi:nitroimidazol reductase NimA-like FMN-containing flavoprotein (pyridoxamine 5'-phosphate oxidase superfamily)